VDARSLITQAVAGKRPSPKGWVRANCPFCEWRHSRGVDRSQSFGFHVERLRYECYRCGIKGWLREPIEEYEGFHVEGTEEAKPIEPPEGYMPLWDSAGQGSLALAPARRYLARRNIGRDLCERLRIGACLDGRYAGRVVVPVLSPTDDWLWWVARTWSPNEDRRYLYPMGARHGLMFNQVVLSEETDEPVAVVEGVFDAIPHLPDVVACLGKPTDEHVEALARARRPVVVVLDGDAWEEGWAIHMRLQLAGQRATWVKLPPRTDPGVTSHEALADLIGRACAACNWAQRAQDAEESQEVRR